MNVYSTKLYRPLWIVILLLVCFYQPAYAEKPSGVSQNGTIILGGDQNFPPSTFVKDGRPSGFQVDIIKAVVAASGLKVEVVFSPWKEALENLRTGRIDVMAMSYSQKREEDFDFTVQFALNAFGLMVRQDSDIRSIPDIKGKKIFVQQGGVMQEYIQNNNIDADITYLGDVKTIVRSLSEGRSDGAFLSKKTAYYIVKQLGISDLHFTDEIINPKRTAFGVTEGNYELIKLLNEGLAVINANGQLKEINEKWFGLTTGNFVNVDLVKKWVLRGVGVSIFVLVIFILWTNSLKNEINMRRTVEEKLRASENKYRGLSDAAFEGIAITKGGRFIEVNDAFVKMSGYKAAELMDKPVVELISPEEREIVKSKILSGYEKPYETIGLRKDGSKFPVEAHAKIFLYKERQVRVTAIRDLTQQKKAEEEIKTLRGILPICSICKDIRNEEGHYENMEAYIDKRSDLKFSHTICTPCMKEHYPEEYEAISAKNNKK